MDVFSQVLLSASTAIAAISIYAFVKPLLEVFFSFSKGLQGLIRLSVKMPDDSTRVLDVQMSGSLSEEQIKKVASILEEASDGRAKAS